MARTTPSTATPTRPAKRGAPRKPLPASGNHTVVGSLGTHTPATPAPARTRKVAAPKAAAAPKATPAKAVPASRQLPRDLVTQVAALYAKASPQDRQRVANYLKVVTTGTDANGDRWWPDHTNLPRPTHFSWAKSTPAPVRRTRKATA